MPIFAFTFTASPFPIPNGFGEWIGLKGITIFPAATLRRTTSGSIPSDLATDFIFSVIGEELGLIGVLFIIALYALIFWRGIIIARNAKDTFGAFMATGLTIAIILQVCVNMGVTLGLLPTKGLTLPFLSYGGTSLLINMASIGILMNIGATKTDE